MYNIATEGCNLGEVLVGGAAEIRKLQRIQSMAAKVVARVTKFDSSTTALKSLHWLPIHLRIKFKVLTLVLRAVHKLTPAYLTELIIPATTRREGLRSQSTACTLSVPFTKRKTFADRAFSAHGPRSCNALPDDLRSLKFIQNLFFVDGPKGSKKRCILIRGGFFMRDRFEFGSVDQQVRNRGINPG